MGRVKASKIGSSFFYPPKDTVCIKELIFCRSPGRQAKGRAFIQFLYQKGDQSSSLTASKKAARPVGFLFVPAFLYDKKSGKLR